MGRALGRPAAASKQQERQISAASPGVQSSPTSLGDDDDGGGGKDAAVNLIDDEPQVLVCRQGQSTALHPQSPIQGTDNPKSLKFPNMMMYGDRGNATR